MFYCITRQKTLKNGRFHNKIVSPYNIIEPEQKNARQIILQRIDGMRDSRNANRGLVFAAFGAGLLLALCFPTKIMLFILAIMLVILGVISCSR